MGRKYHSFIKTVFFNLQDRRKSRVPCVGLSALHFYCEGLSTVFDDKVEFSVFLRIVVIGSQPWARSSDAVTFSNMAP